jgi:putative inorganic carbon (HCO3(-)) transporter
LDPDSKIVPSNTLTKWNLHTLNAIILVTLFYVFFLNHIVGLSLPLNLAVFLLLILSSLILVLRFKAFMLYALSFLIPVSIPYSIGQTNVSVPAEVICMLLSIFFVIKLLLGYKLPKKLLKHPVSVFILLELIWMFVTSCTSEAPQVSFKRLVIRGIYYITFYYFYFELFRLDKKNIGKIFLLHCLGFLVPIINTMIFHIGLNFKSVSAQLASAPFYNDHTMYGAALAFFIPFLFINTFQRQEDFINKYLAGLLLLVFSAAAFFSYSRAAWASLIIAAVFGMIFRYKISYKYILICALILGSLTVMNFEIINTTLTKNNEVSRSEDVATHFKSISNINSDASNKERINRWKCAIRMFESKPLFGFGPGTYQFYYGAFQVKNEMTVISTYSGTKGHSHSEYLNVLSEQGLIGLLLLSGLIITVCIKAIKLIKKTDKYTSRAALSVFLGLCTFFIHAFFNGFIEFEKLAMPVFMSYAAITFLDLDNSGKPGIWAQRKC